MWWIRSATRANGRTAPNTTPIASSIPTRSTHSWRLGRRWRWLYRLGAVSSTSATDGDDTWATNVELSRRLWTWCTEREVRFTYASSASTYGDGSNGFDDDSTPTALDRLRPLSLYGWTKHAFDLTVARRLANARERPPQWVGLKFFNVYGPNEYHKGKMISVVKIKYDEIMAGGPARLFRSAVPGLADGAQARDFIWVGDVVDTMLWLFDNPNVNGLSIWAPAERGPTSISRTRCATRRVSRAPWTSSTRPRN